MIGYKAFEEKLINRYGMDFKLGKEYTVSGTLKFGLKGNGFHFCKNLEDTLRFVDGTKAVVVQVEASGDLKEYNDEYNDYYDMYVTNKIKIVRIISKEEILKYTLSLSDYRLIRMIRDYKRFTKEEISLLEEIFKQTPQILNAILYYQKGDKDVYNRNAKKIKTI